MAKRKVIKSTSLATSSPIMPAAFWWMFLDYINASGWAYGVWGVIVFLASVAFIHDVFCCDTEDVPGFGQK